MADKQCSRCGYINPSRRGACLMCYYYLDGDDAGVPYVGDNPAVDIVAAALALLETTGGAVDTDEDTIGPGPAYADEEEEMSGEEAAAFAEFKAQQSAMRDDALGVGAAAEDEEEEEGAFSAPSALALEQSVAAAQSEPDAALSLDDAMSATIPGHEHAQEAAPAVVEPVPDAEVEETDLAPPPPMDGFGFDNDIDFADADSLDDAAMAPPVPAGLGGFDDEAAPAPAAPEPPGQPEAAAEASDDETDQEALGGWSLTFDDEK